MLGLKSKSSYSEVVKNKDQDTLAQSTVILVTKTHETLLQLVDSKCLV